MTDTEAKTEIKPKKPRRLTIKQKKFVENYIKTGNGLESVKKAGYDVKNDESAKVVASINLTKFNVNNEIKQRTAEIEQKTNITVEFIQKEHLRLAQLAEQKGDLVNSARHLEGLAKTIGAYKDNLNVSNDKPLELSQQEKELAEKKSAELAEELSRMNIKIA